MPPPPPPDVPPTKEERIADAAAGLAFPLSQWHAFLEIERPHPQIVTRQAADGSACQETIYLPGPLAKQVASQAAVTLYEFGWLDALDSKWVALATLFGMCWTLYEKPFKTKMAASRVAKGSPAPEPAHPVRTIPQYEPELHQDDEARAAAS